MTLSKLQQIGLIVALLPTLLLLLWLTLRRPELVSGTTHAFDTVSGKLYATNDCIPPLRAPSGPDSGVLAHVIHIDGESEPTVVFLTTLTPAASEAVRLRGWGDATAIEGMLVKRPTETAWSISHSAAGQAIRHDADQLAAGRTWRLMAPEAADE